MSEVAFQLGDRVVIQGVSLSWPGAHGSIEGSVFVLPEYTPSPVKLGYLRYNIRMDDGTLRQAVGYFLSPEGPLEALASTTTEVLP